MDFLFLNRQPKNRWPRLTQRNQAGVGGLPVAQDHFSRIMIWQVQHQPSGRVYYVVLHSIT